jgi:integrase-like protein
VVAADFFTTEVWTVRGLVTYYTLFVIELHSRRVSIVGSTPHPDEAFVRQVVRQLTAADEGVLDGHRVLICDRDRKWSVAVRELLETSGVRVIQTPFRAPNCNAHAERFVRSVKEECLDRMIPVGERHFRRALADFVVHYHRERNHQGLGNEVIDGMEVQPQSGRVSEWVASSVITIEPRSPTAQGARRNCWTLREITRGVTMHIDDSAVSTTGCIVKVYKNLYVIVWLTSRSPGLGRRVATFAPFRLMRAADAAFNCAGCSTA